jgi:predicted TPR repeat methyltransferase
MVGCDLSPIMIQQASRSEFVSDGAHELVYRSVVVSDAVDFVSACGRSESDLVLAADVVCYMGDLRALLQKVRFALKIGGTLLFSVEELEGPSVEAFSLQPSGRFAHSEHYIVDLAGRCGYEVTAVQRGVLRADGGVPVNGAAFALVAVDLSGACELGSE